MLVFCNGMPRSGSTWSFNVVLGLLRRCFPGREIQSGYSETPVEFLKAAPSTAVHSVLKCHYLTPLARTLVQTQAAKVVYTWRDLPDAVASWLAIFGGRFEESLQTVGSSLELLAFHRSHGNAVIIPYDELFHRPKRAIRRIAEYLAPGKLSPAILSEVAEETSFRRMREKVERINVTDTRHLIGGPESWVDPETHLHRYHIWDGRPGYGAATLTARQLERIKAFVRRHRERRA